jgi:peroxiredoxin
LIFAIGRAMRGLVGAVVGAVAGLVFAVVLVGDQIGSIPLFSAPPPPPDAPRGKVVDIAGPTLQGEKFDLKDYRGKVVLVDFWATWCVPCVQELPNVLHVYERYHDRGFEVVGVSLDDSRERLQKFVADRGLPWPQIFMDSPNERGWKAPLARKYGVRAIPATFLIDPDGQLAFKGLRGSNLETAVGHLLGQPEDIAGVPIWKLVLVGGFLGGTVLGAGVQRVTRSTRVPPVSAQPVPAGAQRGAQPPS